MPIVNKKSLQTIHDVGCSLDYLGDGEHENHRNHSVEAPRYFGRFITNKADFLAGLARAIKSLNEERSPSNQLKISATWWTLAFPTKSNLSSVERVSYEDAMLTAIGCSKFGAVSWHNNLFNGSADLNIIDPGIDLGGLGGLGGLPDLHRSNKTNLLNYVRARSDDWLRATNTKRVAAVGVPPVITVAEAQAVMPRKTPRAELVRILAASYDQNSPAPCPKTLPKILERAGFKNADWEIDLKNQLLVWRFPGAASKPRKKPIVRIQMEHLIREIIEISDVHGIRLETKDTPACDSKPTPPMRNPKILPPLRTRLDVLHHNKNKEEI